MRNHLFVILAVLIFSTSFNQGAKLRTNDRRASGLMAYPRIGRSDLPVPTIDFNRHHDTDLDVDLQLYNSEPDYALDKDYEDPRNLDLGFHGRSINLKHVDKVPKEASWLIPDRLRSIQDYQPWQTIDNGRTFHSKSPSLVPGFRNSQLDAHVPRLGRENEVEHVACK